MNRTLAEAYDFYAEAEAALEEAARITMLGTEEEANAATLHASCLLSVLLEDAGEDVARGILVSASQTPMMRKALGGL